jgi:hypothetical protein
MAEGRRYPANLQGLLAFCTEYTKTEDAPNESNAVVMDAEVMLIVKVIHKQLMLKISLMNLVLSSAIA